MSRCLSFAIVLLGCLAGATTAQPPRGGRPFPPLKPDETALFEAIRNDKLDQATALVAKGVSLTVRDQDRRTPISVASALGHNKIVELLVATGADINDMDEAGTPLWWAANRGDLEQVAWCLEQGADPNKQSRLSPAGIAIIQNHPEVVKLLLSKGAKPDVYTCALTGDSQTLAELLQADPKLAQVVAEPGTSGKLTPLHLATAHGHAEAVRILLAHGADMWQVDPNRHWAMELSPNLAILKLFVAQGNLTQNVVRAGEVSQLVKVFIESGRSELAEYLMQQGVLPSNAPQLMLTLDLDKDQRLLKQLIANGSLRPQLLSASVAARNTTHWLEDDPSGLTDGEWHPKKPEDVARDRARTLWLLEQGCPIDGNFQVAGGLTFSATCPLNEAIRYNDQEIVRVLLKKGVNITPQIKAGPNLDGVPTPQSTHVLPPLIVAAGDLELSRLLAEAGADVNAASETGYTPLHAAADGGHRDVVEFLLSQGADPKAKTIGYKTVKGEVPAETPAQMAAAKGHTELSRLLQSKE